MPFRPGYLYVRPHIAPPALPLLNCCHGVEQQSSVGSIQAHTPKRQENALKTSDDSSLADLNLHDAVVESIAFGPSSHELRFVVSAVGEEEMTVLAFSNITSLSAQTGQPWGRSQSVNELRCQKPGEFQVELQSGDVWSVHAERWRYFSTLEGEA